MSNENNSASTASKVIEDPNTIGAAIKRYRQKNDWPLKTLSEKCGIPVSTLSKVENGQMSLRVEKLLAVCQALDVDIMLLVSPDQAEPTVKVVTGRRSITKKDEAIVVKGDNSNYEHHAHDLSNRLMSPTIIEIFPNRNPGLLKHAGEEFIYVLEGRVEAITEFYQPTVLEVGDSMYIDSTMAHNVRALDNKTAKILNISTVNKNTLLG